MSADSNSLPTQDTSQDVNLISATEQDGRTTVVFTRKVNTCDENDRQLKVHKITKKDVQIMTGLE